MNSRQTQLTDQSQQNKYTYYDPKFTLKPFGMNNTGAVCWCNSILQMFFSLPAMNKIILERENDFSENPFAQEYIRVLKSTVPNESGVNQPDVSQLNLASTAILQAFMKQAEIAGYKIPIGKQQECVDEAFVMFIDVLDNQHIKKIFTNAYNLTMSCPSCQKETSTMRDSSYNIRMFTHLKLESDNLFRDWLRIHPSVVDSWKCSCGKCFSNIKRQEKLCRLSEIIIITFNKFYSKDLRWFPERIKFNAKNGPDLEYELVARVEHSGGMNGGHYWCHAKRSTPNGMVWRKFDDANVSAGNSSPTTATFIVAYHLMKPVNEI